MPTLLSAIGFGIGIGIVFFLYFLFSIAIPIAIGKGTAITTYSTKSYNTFHSLHTSVNYQGRIYEGERRGEEKEISNTK